MNGHREQDPFDALRAANPVADDQLPPASLARLRARVYEESMAARTDPQTAPTQLARVGLGLGAAAALAVAVLVGGGAAGWFTPNPTTGPGTAMCVEQYSLATLGQRGLAFDGTVTAITGDRVTFAIGTAYRGVAGTTVTLNAPGMTGTAVTSAGGPNLVVGGRYLVAGEADFAWACGFTQPYEAGVAASWAAALGG